VTIPKRKTVRSFDSAFRAADDARRLVQSERPANPTDEQWITYYTALADAGDALAEVYGAALDVAPSDGIVWSALWEARARTQAEVRDYRKSAAAVSAVVARRAEVQPAESSKGVIS